MIDWQALFESIEFSPFGQAIKTSPYAFASLEAVHLLAFAALGGSLLLVDLRALGLGLRRQPVPELARGTRPVLLASLGVMAATGIPMFASEAVKCYYNTAFWWKMSFLFPAIVFTFTVRSKVTTADEVRPVVQKVVACLSLALWFGVAAAGRWIGWSG